MITQNRSDWLRAMQDHLRGPTCRFLDATQNKLQLHHCIIIIVPVKLFQNIFPFFSKGTRRELLLQWHKIRFYVSEETNEIASQVGGVSSKTSPFSVHPGQAISLREPPSPRVLKSPSGTFSSFS